MTKKSRGVLIAGNWKMNHSSKETEAFFNEMSGSKITSFKSGAQLRAVLIPPMLSLARAQELSMKAPFPVSIAAQNAHWEKKGAFTGEVSGPMLQELGLKWVLIGHSERRQFFGETDETVRKRTESLLAQGFLVIHCIGETRAERESGNTQAVLERQLAQGLVGPNTAPYLDGRLVIAYEPVWAIGTGLTATPEQAQEAHRMIRAYLAKHCGTQAAERTQLLYGGSVTVENIKALLNCEDVDGALVGGASLKPESFLALVAAGDHALQT